MGRAPVVDHAATARPLNDTTVCVRRHYFF